MPPQRNRVNGDGGWENIGKPRSSVIKSSVFIGSIPKPKWYIPVMDKVDNEEQIACISERRSACVLSMLIASQDVIEKDLEGTQYTAIFP